jgi:hypothetical protein
VLQIFLYRREINGILTLLSMHEKFRKKQLQVNFYFRNIWQYMVRMRVSPSPVRSVARGSSATLPWHATSRCTRQRCAPTIVPYATCPSTRSTRSKNMFTFTESTMSTLVHIASKYGFFYLAAARMWYLLTY